MTPEVRLPQRNNYMTQETYQSLMVEIVGAEEEVKNSLAEIGEAAGSGSDWHDNAAFDHANIKHDVVSIKRGGISAKLINVVIIEPSQSTDKVSIGNDVTVKYKGEEETEVYTILGPADARRHPEWISFESPLGAALIDKKVGDEVTFEVQNQKQSLKIIGIAPGSF